MLTVKFDEAEFILFVFCFLSPMYKRKDSNQGISVKGKYYVMI